MFIYVILNEVKDLVPIYPDEMLTALSMTPAKYAN